MTLHSWASLSLVWLAIVGLIIALIEGVILYLMVKGMIALNSKLSKLFPTVRMYFYKANQVTHKVSDKVAAPMIAASAKAAQVQRIRRSIINPSSLKGRM
jgi:hypothetical protein